jgi:sRNA-binding carbon storage regulator CsrA
MEYGRLVLSRNDGEGILIDCDMYRFFCNRYRTYFTCWQNSRHSLPFSNAIETTTSRGEKIFLQLAQRRDKRSQIKVAIIAPRHINILREELAELEECDAEGCGECLEP